MDSCQECVWNRVHLLKLQDKYDAVIQLLTVQVEELQNELLEMQQQGGWQV